MPWKQEVEPCSSFRNKERKSARIYKRNHKTTANLKPLSSGGKKRNREENFRGIAVDEDRNKKRKSTLDESACPFCSPPGCSVGMIIGTSGGWWAKARKPCSSPIAQRGIAAIHHHRYFQHSSPPPPPLLLLLPATRSPGPPPPSFLLFLLLQLFFFHQH